MKCPRLKNALWWVPSAPKEATPEYMPTGYMMVSLTPALAEFPEFLEPVRADKIAQPGMITTQVIELLLDAKLVIADLSLLNPNAFYEVGIRHMAQKPIIHMQLKSEAPPFDVNGYRAIKFSVKHPDDLVTAQRELIQQIKIAVAEDHRVENPVTHARGQIKIREDATPREKVLINQLAELSARVGLLEIRNNDPPEAIDFRRENFEIEHLKEVSTNIHRRLREIMGERLEWAKTNAAGTNTVGYFDLNGMSYDKVQEFESRIESLRGVKHVSVIPF